MFLKTHNSKIYIVCITQANLTAEVKDFELMHDFFVEINQLD